MSLLLSDRVQQASHPLAKKLLQVMSDKETNLAVSADVEHAEQLLELADRIGPEICVFKTHIDTLADYTPEVAKQLASLAAGHHFMIFEDRKFADIGQTVKNQYGGGLYRIADWAHITNAHILPGEGIIEGLKTIGMPLGRGLLLLAEMSSKGHYFDDDYRQACFDLAGKHAEFVMGFICQQGFADPRFIYMTPGVQLQAKADSLGQQYRTPDVAITEQGCDIIIVGRGITAASDQLVAAKQYRQEGWKAYLRKIS